jgi:hypothetical protein
LIGFLTPPLGQVFSLAPLPLLWLGKLQIMSHVLYPFNLPFLKLLCADLKIDGWRCLAFYPWCKMFGVILLIMLTQQKEFLQNLRF